MNQPLTQSKATQALSHPPALAAAQPVSAGTARPSHDEIAKRAYEIYLKKDRKQGQCEPNWLQAERELASRAAAAPQSKPSGDKPAVTHSYSGGSR